MANASSVAVQMKQILDEYDDQVQGVVRDSIKKVAKESAQKLKSTSPRRTGSYASSWSVKQVNDKDAIVHNTKHYRLTHLLENGHVVKNKKGTYGRAPAIKHIAPVEAWANDELTNEIERQLR